jgi:RNA polymerase sigma-70 factor (ECF subfamily)
MSDFRRGLVELLPRLRRFALALCHAPNDADDLVQAAVERALLNADSWQPGTRLDSWLYRIVQNLWRDELRAHRRLAEPLEAAENRVGEDGREVTMRHLQISEAAVALQALPEDQRMVMVLVVLDDMSYQQAAEVLGVPIGTVMSRLARARGRMAEALGGDAAPRKAGR